MDEAEARTIVEREFRPLYDEMQQRACKAEELWVEAQQIADHLSRTMPRIDNMFGWRWAFVLGRFVIGWRQ